MLHPSCAGVRRHCRYRDGGFDVVLALLTVHHWDDVDVGLRELQRVAARQIVLTWDPVAMGAERFWLTRDYVPEASGEDWGFAALPEIVAGLGPARVRLGADSARLSATASSALTGAVRRRISIPTCAARSPRSRSRGGRRARTGTRTPARRSRVGCVARAQRRAARRRRARSRLPARHRRRLSDRGFFGASAGDAPARWAPSTTSPPPSRRRW